MMMLKKPNQPTKQNQKPQQQNTLSIDAGYGCLGGKGAVGS